MVNPIGQASTITTVHGQDFAAKVSAGLGDLRGSSIKSFGSYRAHSFGDAIFQVFEMVASLAVLPFFIYTFFIAATFSIIFLPFAFILLPLFFVGEVMREIMHTILPWVFPDPKYRY